MQLWRCAFERALLQCRKVQGPVQWKVQFRERFKAGGSPLNCQLEGKMMRKQPRRTWPSSYWFVWPICGRKSPPPLIGKPGRTRSRGPFLTKFCTRCQLAEIFPNPRSFRRTGRSPMHRQFADLQWTNPSKLRPRSDAVLVVCVLPSILAMNCIGLSSMKARIMHVLELRAPVARPTPSRTMLPTVVHSSAT